MVLREIPGIKNYLASDCGKIFSFKTKRFLKLSLNQSGYPFVALCEDNNNIKRYLVSRLIAKAFIPNPDNKPKVKYLDGDKLNTKPDNLKWCTINEILEEVHKNNEKKRCWKHSSYGEIIATVPELIKMFEEHKYYRCELYNVANGKKPQYRGWTVQHLSD